MRWNHYCIFVFLLWPTIVKCQKEINEFEQGPVGIIDELLNKTLELMRPNLVNLHIKNQNFETGPQEFGKKGKKYVVVDLNLNEFSRLNGTLSEVLVEGLDKFIVTVINTTFLDLNNLTIVQESFTAKGLYKLNGSLIFPLAISDIHFFGDGEFSAKFTNFSFSMKMKIRLENGNKVVKDLDIVVGLDKIVVNLKNLMDGGEVETVFNKLINDVGLTFFNYYKGPILKVVKPLISQLISDMLNKKIPSNSKLEP